MTNRVEAITAEAARLEQHERVAIIDVGGEVGVGPVIELRRAA